MIVVDLQMICDIAKRAIDVSAAFNADGIPDSLSDAQNRALMALDATLAPLILEHFQL